LPYPAPGWTTLLGEWGRELRLWALIVAALQLFRLLLIGLFADDLGPGVWSDIAAVMAVGLRFDVSTAAIWLLPTLLFSVSTAWLPWVGASRALRLLSWRLFVLLALFLFAVDLVYVDEYGDQFNQTLFGLVHDDTEAILITIWKGYHPLPILLGVGLLSALVLHRFTPWLTRELELCRRLRALRSPITRTLALVAILLLYIAMGRGGTLWGEPIRLKHAFVAEELFLNRCAVNPFTALRLALETHQQLQAGGGLELLWPSGDLQQALVRVAGQPGNDIDQALTQLARGHTGPAPKHLFVLLMESHSGWTVMPAWRDIGLSPQLAALAEQGLYFPHTLPASSGTIGSMNALIAGLPDAGLHINYEPRSTTPYPSALAAIFKRLGYRSRFFYGGYLSWQRLDSFAIAQGFDELYGGGHMSAGAQTNEWGVADAVLFDFVLSTLRKAPDTPSINFILTTSNHPPYDLDLEALGYPVKALPETLTITKEETLKVLGHLWYADREAGRFVRNAEAALPGSLFALTGDHTARLQVRFPGDNVFEQYAVPLIFYGPRVIPQAATLSRPASHQDLVATLVGLSAPAGFPYVSFGHDLLAGPDPKVAQGFKLMIGEDWIATTSEPPQLFSLGLEGEGPAPGTWLTQARDLHQALLALSWQRVKHGSALHTAPGEP